MAHTKVTRAYGSNTGAANTYSYSGSFDTFKATEVVVTLDNVELTYTASTINESASPREYTVDYTNKTIHIGGADLSSGTIVIKPETDLGSPTPRATYSPGASITSEDLNNNQKQLLRRAMEYEEQVMFKSGGTMTGDLTMDTGQTVIFEGATADAYETTLTVTDPTADRTITLPNVTGTVVTTGDTATVTATMMASNSVGAEELSNDAVDIHAIQNNAVTTAKIAADAITGAKIADDAIDSEHYTDGSIDTAHIGAAQVTTAKLADNAVTTAKITDGNITTAKLAADVITAAKIGDDIINSEHIAAGAVDLEHMSANSVDSDQYVDHSIDAVHIADNAIDSNHYVNGSIDLEHMSANSVDSDQYVDASIDGAHISNDAIDSQHYAAASIDNEHLADDAVGADELAANAVVNASIASGAAIDHAKLAAVSSGNVLVGNGSNQAASVAMSGDVAIAAGGATTIQANAVEIGMIGCEQTTISDSDSHIPTSGAVVDYVAAQIAPIGGLEVIADDESFPNTIPPAGVVISISDAAGLQVNSSGVSTNGDALDNSTITINGFPSELRGGVGTNADPYVFASGAGLMVQSTGSSHTYNYHQALIREADFVNLSDDINDFNNRYRIASSAPGSDNDEGDLYFNTSTNKMNVYDGSAWGEVTSTGDYKLLGIKDNGQAYNGTGPTFNGSNDQYDLFDGSSDAYVVSAGQLLVVLNGILQRPLDDYAADGEGFALDGSDGIRFCDPPASGSTLFVTQIGTATTLSVPADNSVTSAKIQDGAVATADLAADAVTGAKIADDAVGAEHIEMLDAALQLADSVELQIGTNQDLRLYHNDNNAHIKNLKGNLYIQTNDGSGGTETGITIKPNSAVELNYDNSKKFETTSAGATVTGVLTATLAANSIDSDHYVDGSIDHVHLAGDAVDGDNIADDSIGAEHIADNAVGLAAMAGGTDGVIITYDASGNPVHVGPGTDGQVLTSTGSGSPPAFEDAAGGGVTSDAQNNTVAGDGAGADFTGTDANSNTLIGKDAGAEIEYGDYNTALGHLALSTSTGSDGQTALGYGALRYCQNGGTNNTAVGNSALYNCTTGDNNVALGKSALGSLDTGSRNTGTGREAGASIQGGDDNTCSGYRAGYALVGGSDNVAMGSYALDACTAGTNLVAIGKGAGGSLVDCTNNIAIGRDAMTGHVNANHNLAIGRSAMATSTSDGSGYNLAIGHYSQNGANTAEHNLSIGYEAMGLAATTGARNQAIGNQSCENLTSGADNTAMGVHTLEAANTAQANIAIGNYALEDVTDGTRITAMGYAAGQKCITSDYCVFIGYEAGRDINSAHCTMVGYNAGKDNSGMGPGNTAVGSYAMSSGTSGDSNDNTAIGYTALYSLTSGNNNTACGGEAGKSIEDGYNNTCLGYQAGQNNSPSGSISSDSNEICLGNDNVTSLFCADTSISSSDSRDKADIANFTPGLGWVKALRPVTYKWDKRSWYLGEDEKDITKVTRDGSKKATKTNVGFLAQEVLDVEKAHGYSGSADTMLTVNLTNDGNRYGLKYERLVPVLVNAIKELSDKNDALEARIAALEAG